MVSHLAPSLGRARIVLMLTDEPSVPAARKAIALILVRGYSNKRRRLVEAAMADLEKPKFMTDRPREIRAYKMGGKTLIDLDSVDEYHTLLPRVETRAS